MLRLKIWLRNPFLEVQNPFDLTSMKRGKIYEEQPAVGRLQIIAI